MHDRVFLEGLRIQAVHGARAHERKDPQTFVVDLSAVVDLTKPSNSDELAEAFDYGKLRDIATRVFAGPPRNLLEKLANDIALEVLDDDRALEVTVTIRKQTVYEDCVPGVSITRSR